MARNDFGAVGRMGVMLGLALYMSMSPAMAAPNDSKPLVLKPFEAPAAKIDLDVSRSPFSVGFLEVKSPISAPKNISGKLISIDRRDLTELTDRDVYRLLFGPVNTIKRVALIDQSDKVTILDMICQPIAQKSLWDVRYFDATSLDLREAACNNADIECSYDLVARAAQNLGVQKTIEELGADNPQISASLFDQAITCYELGDFVNGDKARELSQAKYQSSHPWRLGNCRSDVSAIPTLLAVGRPDAAMELWQRLYVDHLPAPGTISGGEPLALYFLQMGDRESARKIASRQSEIDAALPSTSPWVADIYLRLEDYKKAQDLYGKQIIQLEQYQQLTSDTFIQMRIALVRLAEAQFCNGDKTAAVASLKRAVEISKKDMTADLLRAIDQLPLRLPHHVDLEQAIVNLNSCEHFPESISIGPQQRLPQFLPTASIAEAINRGDKAAARAGIESLLNLYQYSVDEPMTINGQPNLYCHIMTCARRMADRGWFDLSNQVLQALAREAYGKDAAPCVKAFLQAELTYNAVKCGAVTQNTWQMLDLVTRYASVPAGVTIPAQKVQSLGERLRLLALYCLYAGELDRAQLFIEQALSHFGQDKGLAVIDAACIAARRKDFVYADKYWQQAIENPASNRAVLFAACRELCSAYVDGGKVDRLLPMLDATFAISAEGNGDQAFCNLGTLKLFYADLQLQKNNASKADAIAKDVQKQLGPIMTWQQSLIVARCAEAVGDYKTAADIYTQKNWADGFTRGAPTDPLPFEQKAIELAEKVPGYDVGKIVQQYLQLSQTCDHTKAAGLEKMIELREKAYQLMPDTDPRKPDLLSSLAWQSAYAKIEADKVAHGSTLSSEQEQVELAKETLGAEVQAAQMAATNNPDNAFKHWRQAVDLALKADRIDLCVAYYHKALACYCNTGDLLGYRHSFLQALVLSGHKDEAIKILDATIDRVRRSSVKSNQANLQKLMADAFEFNVSIGRKAIALQMLDAALACDLATGEPYHQSIMHSHCGDAGGSDAISVLSQIISYMPTHIIDPSTRTPGQVMARDDAFECSVLKKILAAQKRVLAADDERLAQTLCALGDFYHQTKKYAEAQKYYDEAFTVERKYFVAAEAAKLLGKGYVANLKKVDRLQEASQYEMQ